MPCRSAPLPCCCRLCLVFFLHFSAVASSSLCCVFDQRERYVRFDLVFSHQHRRRPNRRHPHNSFAIRDALSHVQAMANCDFPYAVNAHAFFHRFRRRNRRHRCLVSHPPSIGRSLGWVSVMAPAWISFRHLIAVSCQPSAIGSSSARQFTCQLEHGGF